MFKGDLIIRDDLYHIELVTKLVDLMKKKDDKNFLKIIGNNNEENSTNKKEYS